MSTKEAVIEMIRELPETVTAPDIMAAVAERFGPQVADEPALLAELDRRREEHLSGRDPGIPADEFFRQLRQERGR